MIGFSNGFFVVISTHKDEHGQVGYSFLCSVYVTYITCTCTLCSSVRRASRLECVRCGFESHLSAAFSLEKVVSGLVLCCVVLLCLSFFLLSERLSNHVYAYCTHVHEHVCCACKSKSDVTTAGQCVQTYM